jgi:predicted ATPase
MHVSEVSISNIKCFARAHLLLSPGINVLVGKNNSGKSTLIQTLCYLQQPGSITVDAVRIGAVEAKIAVVIDAAEAAAFPDPPRTMLLGGADTRATATFKFNLSAGTVSSAWTCGNQSANFAHFPNTQPRNLIVTYMTDRRGGGFTESVNASNAHSIGSNFQALVAKIDRCYGSPTLRPAYEAACVDVLGFVITTWATANGKMAGLEIDPIGQQYIPIGRMGAGVASALALIVELLVSRDKLFLIEELENDMHPGALRMLLGLIERGAELGNQFVISTHSNVMVRHLGSISGTKLWEVRGIPDRIPPESIVEEVSGEPAVRRALLESLGYDLIDYDLYSAWLILEESSAERIIREFLVRWFVPTLTGRLRTVAAQGASDVDVRFSDLHRLFTFIHLEPMYVNRAWVLCDGDAAGLKAVAALHIKFGSWPKERFATFGQPDFERYYPAEFRDDVASVLAVADRQARRLAKGRLLNRVVDWLLEDEARGRAALEQSATEIIDHLRKINRRLAGDLR